MSEDEIQPTKVGTPTLISNCLGTSSVGGIVGVPTLVGSGKYPLLRLLIRITLFLLALALLTYLILPKPELYPAHTTFSRQVFDREGNLMHLTLTDDGKYRVHTPLAEFSADLIAATLRHEDQHYFTHPGINPVSLLRGTWGMLTGTRLGGGSTITMQYARLRFNLQTRSILGKMVQVGRALQLERHYSKQELLEAYLNLAPYGANVEGAGAASLLWCGKPVHEVSLREAVSLSVIPQSPSRRTPKTKEDNTKLAAAQFRLFQQVQSERGLRADPLDGTFTLRPETRVPREAPHLSRRLLAETTGGEVKSLIDLNRQRTVEEAFADFIGRKKEVGISNASALLVHAPSREVLAYVGSSAFLNDTIQGQVDGVTARRSPGSALKPFIYGLALDQGLIHPRSLLRDSRVSFGEYNPENFDRGFAGPISASEALYRSRNIPAVALAQRLAAPGLYGFLKQADVALPKPAEHYGLSLPLGGGEVTMEELAGLYALLADDGRPRPLRYFAGEPAAAALPEPLLSQEACFLVREMLTLREGDDPSFDDAEVKWKTGTSHRFRDAWAAGMRGEYVLIVWIGNFNGKANPAFVARECAAPLLFETFHRLNLPLKKTPPPAGVERVELCAVSGQLPTPHCEHRLHGWFMPGVSPIAPCDIHREVLTDPATGLRVARDDGTRTLQRQVYEFWAPDLLEMFRQAGVPRREPPTLEAGASSLLSGDSRSAPRIVSPKSALVYTLRASDTKHKTISLVAETAAGVRKLYWFAGQQFLGATEPTQPMSWSPQPGRWTVQVMDDRGQSCACQVRVEMVE
ncbi:MAG: penicillin-binding protein 1C [Verrucomicrobium sp.]